MNPGQMTEFAVDDQIEELQGLKQEFLEEVKNCADLKDVDRVRTKYLSKKGLLQKHFSLLGQVSPDVRPLLGKELNSLRSELSHQIQLATDRFQQVRMQHEKIDLTLPGFQQKWGRKHPITKTLDEIKDIFSRMGFTVEEGPEIENDYYNFEALNMPEGHPARAMQDSFYLAGGWVLRTHTSPVQIRVMESQSPPIRMIAPGRCYRKDTPDATHFPVFHQVEGLAVDTDLTFADLKGTMSAFAKSLFGPDMRIRFRPSYFQFTEPSAEYDFSCIICKGKGCKACKGSGWLEISGAGMVDPEVFKAVGYDPEKYTGFAWGMGVERIAMLKYGISDIRYLYENDLRFIEQS